MLDTKIVPERLDYELLQFLVAANRNVLHNLTKTGIVGRKADLLWDRKMLDDVTKAVHRVSKQISCTIKNWYRVLLNCYRNCQLCRNTWMFKINYQLTYNSSTEGKDTGFYLSFCISIYNIFMVYGVLLGTCIYSWHMVFLSLFGHAFTVALALDHGTNCCP
jgi:hypothetical protein